MLDLARALLCFAWVGAAVGAEPWPTLEHRDLDEVSGLSRSLADPEILWALNDSGGLPALYRVGLNGEDLGRVDIAKTMNWDWEALAAFSHQGQPALLIADVGDNDAVRDTVTLYAVSDPGRRGASKLLWRLDFRYEDGPRDCEAVAVDTETRHIYLLSKRDRVPVLYRLPLPLSTPEQPLTAERLGEIRPLPKAPSQNIKNRPDPTRYFSMPTALDFLSDGSGAVVLTPKDAYRYPRAKNQSWLAALRSKPTVVTLPHLRQTEAATVSADGKVLFVTSEKRPAPLLRMPLNPTTASR